ncbi:MAG: hypothetical protein IPG74_12670 [Flavobacteriales bacterium]|nr:hypothetical protein [Flavobacteriales bacterium]
MQYRRSRHQSDTEYQKAKDAAYQVYLKAIPYFERIQAEARRWLYRAAFKNCMCALGTRQVTMEAKLGN